MNANHYIPVFYGNPYDPMSILITNVTVDKLNLIPGDEIGVFDGKICVGSASYDGNAMIGISVSMADPTSNKIDGFRQGNPICFKIWKQKLNFEYCQIKTSYDVNFDTLYRAFGTALVELTAISSEQKPKIYSNQSFFVSENAPKDSLIGTVEADFPQGKFYYEILNAIQSNPFIIDSLTGAISLKQPGLLNYDVIPKYSLPICIYCKTNITQSDTSIVEINIEDVKAPPIITNIKNDTAYVGLLYRKTIKVTDPEGKALTVTPILIPWWLTLGLNDNKEITFEGIPGNQDIGESEISFLVSDGKNNIHQSYTLNTIQEGTRSNVIIYNNPTSGPFTLFIDQCKDKEIEILVRRLDGNVVYKNVLKNTLNRFVLPIDLSGSIKDIYIVEVMLGNSLISKKLILQ